MTEKEWYAYKRKKYELRLAEMEKAETKKAVKEFGKDMVALLFGGEIK